MPDNNDPAPQPAEPGAPAPAPEPGAAAPGAPAPGAAATDWEAEAKKWEKRAKANKDKADQLDTLTAASQTAEQKAAAASERAERLAGQYVTAELKAALTGIVPDPAAVVADLNHARYVTAEGEIDPDKVTELQARYRAMAPGGPRAPAPNPAQGNGQPPRSLQELAADAQAQAQASGKKQDVRALLRVQSAQLIGIRNNQQG